MIEFSAKDLEKILKLCKNMGVAHFKYAGLEISMDAPDKSSIAPAPKARWSEKKAKEVTELAELKSKFESEKETIETLHLEDPSLYETMLMRGELIESKDY